ncbi:MAG: carboxypeptidase regulatory-like domain-containing protein [Oscillospiraceae bacterium]|jgi:Fe-S-cluster-containing dehydrogenase component|nr:carboxypeptidase regulatory-like domain-containing protein [Oscillospiraceae bacterium]
MLKKPMKKPGIAINSARCMACYACFMACKDEHCGWDTALSKAQPELGQYWMNIHEWERGDNERRVKTATVPTPCSHCDNPACVKAAKDGAAYKREDGIVIIDPEKAVGQKQIVDACPVGAVYWNEALQLPQKCTMCAELLDDPDYPGFEPRCVEACPNQALVFGDLADPESNISKLIAANKVTQLECLGDMGSSVVHLNIPSRFLAGTVAYPQELEEVCIGAKVKITNEASGEVCETETNWAGDYEFENLPKNASYTVEISFPGFKPVVYKGERTDVDHYVGITYLEKE